MLLALVLALASAGTWAAYSSSATTNSDQIDSGTLTLYLTDNHPNPNGIWTTLNLQSKFCYPGGPGVSGEIKIFNVGSTEADHVEISFPIDGTGVPAMAKDMVISNMQYDLHKDGTIESIPLVWDSGSGYDTRLQDMNGNNVVDLDDLSKFKIDNLPAPKATYKDDPYNYAQFTMSLGLKKTNVPQNGIQGKTVNANVKVTLNQDASQ